MTCCMGATVPSTKVSCIIHWAEHTHEHDARDKSKHCGPSIAKERHVTGNAVAINGHPCEGGESSAAVLQVHSTARACSTGIRRDTDRNSDSTRGRNKGSRKLFARCADDPIATIYHTCRVVRCRCVNNRHVHGWRGNTGSRHDSDSRKQATASTFVPFTGKTKRGQVMTEIQVS